MVLSLSCALFVLAIDGPAGAGKSVVASRLARRLGWPLVDTGAIYRAVTLAALRAGLDLTDQSQVSELARRLAVVIERATKPQFEYSVRCDGLDVTADLFSEAIDRHVSIVSAHPMVREALLPLQRGAVVRDSVVVGRDIGTVVFPSAALKVYLRASPSVRAERRRLQMLERGVDMPIGEVLAEVLRRDAIDGGRSVAPMRPAEDAVVVDTDDLTIDDVVRRIETLVAGRLAAHRSDCRSSAATG